MATTLLLDGEKLGAHEEVRTLPGLDVARWDRLHIHVSGGTGSVSGLKVRILFGTPVGTKILLTDSTVWFENGPMEREFTYATPDTYNGTGFVMSVPVVAPQLYDVILTNMGEVDIDQVYVTVMTQEI